MPVKGKEPNEPALTLPDNLSPSTVPAKSRVSGRGEVILADQLKLLPSILPFSRNAQAGARWAKHQDTAHIFVDLEGGAAAFEIRPHPGLSVVIRLPDGEVEDMGTVFDVRVFEQHT